MALHCELHTAAIYDRGGTRLIGNLGELSRVKWERLRDDVSQATVFMASPGDDCRSSVGLSATGRSELVIHRGDIRVWEGPITHVAYQGNSVEITARDIVHYIYRTIMRSEYNSSHPNIETITGRMKRIMDTELVRKEALNPPINVLPHITYHAPNPGAVLAKTSSHTLPWEMTVFEHLDTLAARGGLDYTAVGRALHIWDTHSSIGQTETVTKNDFIGDVIITEYGMELATLSAITDGQGHVGIAGGEDDFYGLVEILDTAYDESTGADWTETGEPTQPVPPSVEDMKTQASRVLAGKNPVPVVVRVPDNSRLNPAGVLSIDDLVPGVFIPLHAEMPGRTISQMQKLDRVTVEETPDGEVISVVMSPAPLDRASNEEDE